MAGFTELAITAPRITEFLADNVDAVKDDDGDASDFIEIHNPAPEPVNLSGYRLTDVASVPSRWVFPAVILQPGEHLVVWASGKNRTHPKSALHTSFRLEKSGGYLALLSPDGTTPLTQYATYPFQFPDRSYGVYQTESVRALVPAGTRCRWTVPKADLPGWQNSGFPDQSWTSARTGIGFDTATTGITYHSLFGSGGDVENAMSDRNATAYLRVPFSLTNRNNMSGLTLKMKYDDGFIAYLNGARIASRFAPDSPAWNSTATALHDDTEAIVFEDIPIPAGLGSLLDGDNILSIHALNGASDNPDFLLVPELVLHSFDLTHPGITGYFLTPTPGAANGLAEAGFTDDPQFSVNRGFFDAPFALTLTCTTPGATIYYTLDSSSPAPRTALVYTGPIAVTRTTVVRALADADARHPSRVHTQSYLFPGDIIRQTAPAGYPATWGTEPDDFGSSVAVPADYAMDGEVIHAPQYAGLTELGLRQSLPVICLTTDQGLLFNPDGIYANGREGSDEIPVSMELLGPGWPGDTQIDGGARIHGGNARQHPKKPFRLYFRKSYGTDKLRYPLFPESPVRSFDQLILRPGGHDGWAVPFGNSSSLLAFHATYVRDQFLRLTETAMGRLSPRGRYVHLYLNGLYWGLYDLHERANADFYASHLGGTPEDWDVVHHPSFVGENYSQVDGNGKAWDEVLRLADMGIHSDADYAALAALINVRDYIDNLIVRMWSGDYDWCSPVFLKDGVQEAEAGYFDNKNWYSARRSRGSPGGFLFHVWDAEMSMGSHLMLNRGFSSLPPWLNYFPPQRIAGFDSTRVGTPGSMAWPYAALRGYPPFRQAFGDRLQKHFFGNGIMTTAKNLARLDSLTSQLELPLVAESARWGDVNRFNPSNVALTRDDHWKPEIDWLRNTFMAGRNALLLGQFNATGLFPATPAPIAMPSGGTVPAGTVLTLTQPDPESTTTFYTLDGSDPAVFSPFTGRTLVEEGASCLWWVPNADIGSSWREPDGPSNPGLWKNGRNGVGFDRKSDFIPHFRTDVGTAMRTIRASVYLRIGFSISSQEEIDNLTGLTLEAKYDDGFIAALNGTVIQRINASEAETFSSAATTVHDDSAAVIFAPFPLNIATIRPLLRVGGNVLALQGLNLTAGNHDFLLTVRLVSRSGGTLSPGPSALRYDAIHPPLLPGNVMLKARSQAGGDWSALTESTFSTGVRASRENLVPSQIHYHPALPSAPEFAAGFMDADDFEFLELLNISSQTVDLSGCLFTNGVDFNFDAAPVRQIPPAGRLIVARNPDALAFRHGPGLPVAGAFANDTGLSNSSERLRLQAADGDAIFDLTYQDKSPWPSSPDGTGPSLVLINPRGLSDPANPRHWRSSLNASAVPGKDDSPGYQAWLGSLPSGAIGPLDDPDDDGWPNLLEYAADTLPFDPDSVPFFTVVSGPAGLILTFPINPDATSIALIVEGSANPGGPWIPARTLTETPSPAGASVRRYETGTATTARRFFRLRASRP